MDWDPGDIVRRLVGDPNPIEDESHADCSRSDEQNRGKVGP